MRLGQRPSKLSLHPTLTLKLSNSVCPFPPPDWSGGERQFAHSEQGWSRTVFTKHEQMFRYPEQLFKLPEQGFRYLIPGIRYPNKRSGGPNIEHRTPTVRTVFSISPDSGSGTSLDFLDMHLTDPDDVNTYLMLINRLVPKPGCWQIWLRRLSWTNYMLYHEWNPQGIYSIR